MSKRQLARFLLFATVAGILLGLGLATPKLKPPTATLSNGTQLSVLAVTHGTNNDYLPGGLWQELVNRFAPARGIGLGRFRIMPIGPMGDDWRKQDGSVAFPHKAVVWLGHRGPTNNPPLPLPEGGQWYCDIRATLADEKGEEWETRTGTAQIRSTTVRGLSGVSSWDFTSYPRRGKTLRFKLYARHRSDAWDTLADFTLPNPTPGPYPIWQPDDLPITRTNGDLAVALVGLISGTKVVQYYPGGTRPFTRATFAVKENGRLTEAWLPDRMEAIDATGNEPWVTMITDEATNNLAAYEMQATSLSPSEVWKLRMRFAKERDSAPENVWTSPDLAVEDGVVSPVSLTTNWQAGDLTLETSEDPFPKTIILRLYPLPNDTLLRVAEFVDDRGRRVVYDGGTFDDSGFHVRWKIPDGAAWVKIAVRLVATCNFEYIAQPTRQ